MTQKPAVGTMKILIISSDLRNPGGVANYIRTLMRYLSSDADHFAIGSRRGPMSPVRRLFGLVRSVFRLRKVLRTRQYDVVHLNPSLDLKSVVRDSIFLFMASRRCRTIVTFHGWRTHLQARITGWKQQLFRYVFSRATVITVLSGTFKQQLHAWGIDAEIIVETTAFDDRLMEGFDAHRKWHGEVHAPVMLFLSRVEREKGIFETLEAYRILKNRHPELTLIVAGSGGSLEAAKQHAATLKLDDVSWPGYVRDRTKAELFARSDLLVLPTDHGEGLPVSVLEAMAFGLAIVTRPVGGLSDIIVDGESGYLVESKDPAEFAKQIERLIGDQARLRAIQRTNHRVALERFAASAVARRFDALYESIAGANGSAIRVVPS